MQLFIKNEDRRLVGGIVYHSGEDAPADSEGDYVESEDELFSGMESFAKNGFNIGHMHKGRADAFVVESFLAESECTKGGKKLSKGDWYLTAKVVDDELWGKVKDGSLSGFSMGGKGHAEAVEKSAEPDKDAAPGFSLVAINDKAVEASEPAPVPEDPEVEPDYDAAAIDGEPVEPTEPAPMPQDADVEPDYDAMAREIWSAYLERPDGE